MKKICLVLWTVGLAAGFLTGCDKGAEQTEDPPLYGDLTDVGDEYIVVGFSQVGSESDWRMANTNSFNETFTEDKGYYLIYEDGQQKQENQLKAIRNFILQEVDYIVLDPIVETGWDGVLQEAKDAGIPVILSDRYIETADQDLYTCWVGSDTEKQGRRAGEWLAAYLENRRRDEEEIQIVTLQGTMGSTAQIGRTEGFEQILEQHDNWTMLDRQTGDFTQAKGEEVMEGFLQTYEDIDVVICENDNMAFGAVEAIHKAGKTCGPDGDIIIISFDAVRAALEALMRGEINATFDVNGKQKTIRLDQPDEINAIYDISNELEDINVHPQYNVINPLAIEYLNSLIDNNR